jgi:hypothetical protein
LGINVHFLGHNADQRRQILSGVENGHFKSKK